MLSYDGKPIEPAKRPTRGRPVRFGPPPTDVTDVENVRVVAGPTTSKPRAAGGARTGKRPRVQIGPPPG
jgi:hypothetical protein